MQESTQEDIDAAIAEGAVLGVSIEGHAAEPVCVVDEEAFRPAADTPAMAIARKIVAKERSRKPRDHRTPRNQTVKTGANEARKDKRKAAKQARRKNRS